MMTLIFVSLMNLVFADPTLVPPEGSNLAKDFNFKGPASGMADYPKWEAQRSQINTQLVNQLELRASEYDKVVKTRGEFVETLRTQAQQLDAMEKNYKPYEKGNNVYQMNELRARMAQTSNTIQNLDTELTRQQIRLERAASNFSNFAKASKLAQTTPDQVKFINSTTGKGMVVSVRHANVEYIQDYVKGTQVGKFVDKAPWTNFSGVIKSADGSEMKYMAKDQVLVRTTNGGLIRGTLEGLGTSTGDIVVKVNRAEAGVQSLRSGQYQVIKMQDVASVHLNSGRIWVPDAVKRTGDFNGKIVDVRPTQKDEVAQLRERYKVIPALSNSNSALPGQRTVGVGTK